MDSGKCLSKVSDEKRCSYDRESAGIDGKFQCHMLFSGLPASKKTSLALSELRISYRIRQLRRSLLINFALKHVFAIPRCLSIAVEKGRDKNGDNIVSFFFLVEVSDNVMKCITYSVSQSFSCI